MHDGPLPHAATRRTAAAGPARPSTARPALRAAVAPGWAPLVLALLATAACTASAGDDGARAAARAQPALEIDADRLARDVSILAHDSMEGRRTGTPGNARARAFLVDRFREIGLDAFADGYTHEFSFAVGEDGQPLRGVNVIGFVRGTERPDRHIVVTAHYDHLGIRNGEIYNGADDNASGTAGLLALASVVRRAPLRHTIVFVAFDAEEMGLRGARAFVADPPIARAAIAMNVNMDMIGRNDRDELYAAGTYHYPWLVPLVDRIAADAPLTLLRGHDRPDLPPGDDWTQSSDHGPFHSAGIPFLYFGVEDHEDYHRPTDTVDRLQPDFHARAAETVLRTLRALDRELDTLRPAGSARDTEPAEAGRAPPRLLQAQVVTLAARRASPGGIARPRRGR